MKHIILISDTGARVRVDIDRDGLRIRRAELGTLRFATKTDAMRMLHYCEDHIRADPLGDLVHKRK